MILSASSPQSRLSLSRGVRAFQLVRLYLPPGLIPDKSMVSCRTYYAPICKEIDGLSCYHLAAHTTYSCSIWETLAPFRTHACSVLAKFSRYTVFLRPTLCRVVKPLFVLSAFSLYNAVGLAWFCSLLACLGFCPLTLWIISH